MPLYEFACAHGHVFDVFTSMSNRNNAVPCEGKVNQLVTDEEVVALSSNPQTLPADVDWVELEVGVDPAVGSPVIHTEGKVLVRKVPCQLQAEMRVTHGSPKSMVGHKLGANRDAAREGRYDPLKPISGIGKGHKWRA